MKKRKIYLGTSGWLYSDWEKIFYPPDLKDYQKLSFYSQYFNSVEVNSSFYRFLTPKTYQKWYKITPKDFGFSLKVNRLITHFKKLKNSIKDFFNFINPIQDHLKEKLKILLFQFPKQFVYNETSFFCLYNFIEKARTNIQLPFAFEFRHLSWENQKVQDLFKKYNIGFVWPDSKIYPKFRAITANFLYLRFHGPKEIFASFYSLKDLKNIAKTIKKFSNLDFFIYFNNGSNYAVLNAQQLKKLIFK